MVISMENKKDVIFIDRYAVKENLFYVLDALKGLSDYSGVMFGLYYSKEYMDVDTTIDYSELSIIRNFIENRPVSDLMFYYMIAPFLNNDYVYVCDYKYKDSTIDAIQWMLSELLISDNDNPDILLKLNPTWYSDNFDSNAYNYDYEGDYL